MTDVAANVELRATLLEPHAPAVRHVAEALRDLVLTVMPDANERIDLLDRVIAFGLGPPGDACMRDLVVGIIPHTAHVNLQLADGVLLDDPDGLIEGTGKRIRHVKCRSLEDVARPELRAIVQLAADRRRER